ncbi:hypothetical protein [Streptomyces scabichelini]|nr:hypothetical protein [Streptomyces scabichelini]
MRRTVRALSATALAAAVLGTTAPATTANEEPVEESVTGPATVPVEEPTTDAAGIPVEEPTTDPAGIPIGEPEEPVEEPAAGPVAEVSPRTVAPGGTVTVSVSCDAIDGHAPETIDATSQAFEHGTVKLHRVAGHDKSGAGAAYSGTARIAPAANFKDGGPDKVGPTSEWAVDGTCPAPPGAEEQEWSATFTVALDGSRHPVVPHGVRAGEGGTFTDSPAALAAGGVLIAGALAAAVHRLLRRGSSANR